MQCLEVGCGYKASLSMGSSTHAMLILASPYQTVSIQVDPQTLCLPAMEVLSTVVPENVSTHTLP
jgi:hypothetical protein